MTTIEHGTAAVDAAIAGVEEQFSVLFNRIHTVMRDRALGVHPDLQPVGFKMLNAIVRLGPTHAGALAERLSTDKSVISRQANILESLGFIERRTDPLDRRASFLVATPAAAEKINEVRASDQAMLYTNLRDWGQGDVERLGELLARLNDTVTGG
ncbi:MarR family winged helix-turn-helix transcriptional regulator [Leifsonia sp. NPDC058292]|uniref:MarR family winged helix-turn-helix transcriptional regulator n=1 Tax=Leifsonia sp. NPDC058292 TaxID=3346428 RepID=UPI0036DD1121